MYQAKPKEEKGVTYAGKRPSRGHAAISGKAAALGGSS